MVNASEEELRAAIAERITQKGFNKTIPALPTEMLRELGDRHVRQLAKLPKSTAKQKALNARRQHDGSYGLTEEAA